MGVDTRAYLKGHVTQEEVLNFIRQTIDPNAHMKVSEETYEIIDKEFYGYDKNLIKTYHGFIRFTVNDEKRFMFYYYSNVNTYDNLKYYSQYHLEDMIKSEKTFISLGHNDTTVDVIKKICTHFGGWFDENDCDDDSYYYIKKSETDEVKPVIHVTMKEIYEKFRGTVVIDY